MLQNVNGALLQDIFVVLRKVSCTVKEMHYELRIGNYIVECHQRRIVQWRNKSLQSEFLKNLDKGGDLSISFHKTICEFTYCISGYFQMSLIFKFLEKGKFYKYKFFEN